MEKERQSICNKACWCFCVTTVVMKRPKMHLLGTVVEAENILYCLYIVSCPKGPIPFGSNRLCGDLGLGLS